MTAWGWVHPLVHEKHAGLKRVCELGPTTSGSQCLQEEREMKDLGDGLAERQDDQQFITMKQPKFKWTVELTSSFVITF